MKFKTLIALAFFSVSIASFAAVRPPKPSDRDVIRLTWTFPDSELASVSSFRIYQGTASNVYDTYIDIPVVNGKVAQIDVTGVVGARFFVATAVGTNGLESLPSVELRLDINGRPTSPSALTGTRITILVD